METAGFVPEPDSDRGTLGIIWACLPTIIFVLWTANHRNSHRSMPRLMWTFFTFFVPEQMPSSAIDQLIKASRLKKQLRLLRGWESWTLKQSFLVVKAGVRVVDSGEVLTPSRLVELAERQQYHTRNIHGAHGGGIRMDMLPSGKAIDYRSKKSGFEKVIAGSQAIWFCANVIARLAEGYTVTPLEDMTIAYTSCGLIASVAWLRCPQDIEDPFEVDLDAEADSHALAIAMKCGYSSDQDGGSSTGSSKPSRSVLGSDAFMMSTVCVVLCVLAVIHMAEWNYQFPSSVESWIWRCCSVAMLPIGLLILFFGDRCRSSHWSIAWTAPGYVIVRLALLTVAATAFRRMPLSAFETPYWTGYWGHIGK